jgi:hypothetical protein
MSAPHDNPEHDSFNSLMDKGEYSLSYTKIDDAVKVIRCYGVGCKLCKTDVKAAFKLIPISPSLWHLHGAKVDGYLFYFV